MRANVAAGLNFPVSHKIYRDNKWTGTEDNISGGKQLRKEIHWIMYDLLIYSNMSAVYNVRKVLLIVSVGSLLTEMFKLITYGVYDWRIFEIWKETADEKIWIYDRRFKCGTFF